MSTTPSTADSAPPASFEERSTWIQLVSLLVAMGGYFLFAGLLLAKGVNLLPPFVPLFLAAVGVLVVINVVAHTVAAIHRRPEQPDERDRVIVWRAEHGSGWILGAGTLLAIGVLCMGTAPVWVAHLLLLSLFLSDTLRCALQLRYYRAGV